MKAKRVFWSAGTALTMILGSTSVWAQTLPETTAAPADRGESDRDVVVTGSRIQRLGFDAPTPTTVISETELRLGNRPSIAQVLNDMPQFRATVTPATTVGNTTSGTATADLRGLGAVRTLTLLDGHRFMGSMDLNTVPQSLIKRVDVVTGGASAAWGSGAVAGVVNIILDDEMKGLRVGAQTGISSRGDGMRYSFDAAWGTEFAGGRGHFMIGGDYTDDKGILSRKSRPNLEAGVFQRANGQLILANDVNYTIINRGGSILGLTGAPYNLVFNPNGTVGPLPLGSETAGQFTVGGSGQNIYDYVAVSSPYERTNVFARATYDLTDSLKLWANGSFNRMMANYGFFPETPLAVIMPDNAFLTATARSQLAAAGVTTPFVLGRILDDVGPKRMLNFKYNRRNLEGAIGLKGKFGETWGYDVYYDHGELRSDQSLYNQRITAKFNNAVDSVLVNGTPTCRINADAITTNDDPACAPINLLGNGNISPQAVAYAFGGTRSIYTNKLDAAGASVHGQPFSTGAGPIDIAFGTDWRWEKLVTSYVDPLSQAKAFSTLNSSATNGKFSVREAFGEVNVPLINIPDTIRLEVNGAARYSDYSTSGGIWTWKTGGTMRVANDLLLRAVYSRDIRSPSITEYYLSRSTNISNLQDPFKGAPQANVVIYSGGNAKLTPEISHTLTLGGSYSPRFLKGFNVSVDYYSISIDNVITVVTPQDTLNQCYAASKTDVTCGGVISRNPNGTIEYLNVFYRNLASYKTRGIDIDGSYRTRAGDGAVTFRVVANHIFDLRINGNDVAGVVGGDTAFSTPKWRVTGAVNYSDESFGVDLRARYVGGGIYSQLLGGNGQPILNNQVSARTYFDLGLQFKVGEFTLFGNVNNMFDVSPPYTPYTNPNYDVIGRYYSAGVKLKF
ncbi:MAG: TonB-dependent receptor [Candidatus Sphingomonas colombiensis]|nr:TonB-dependent receptor [Sphingomonas sp.]WEK42900.1 MAG: TonB-dependent receptor [Sphingomonas sp.]